MDDTDELRLRELRRRVLRNATPIGYVRSFAEEARRRAPISCDCGNCATVAPEKPPAS